MNIISILAAIAVVGGTGLCIGLLLGLAGRKFAVETDERVEQVRALLPGNNCGGCGFAGCDDLAKAMAAGKAVPDDCPVNSADINKELGKMLSISAENHYRMTAYIKCNGTCDKTEKQYHYFGMRDCRKLALIPGKGEKACSYGCMGMGSCKDICPFQAITIEDGIAVVDKSACKACKKCIDICPNHLIELIPYDLDYQVCCNSNGKGKEVKAVCEVGCISCKRCVKQCEVGAVTYKNHLAHIDAQKCIGCGECAQKCPTKVIAFLQV